MKLETVKNVATSTVVRQFMHGKKHSPTIMFVGGVVGVMTATALACRATLKLEEVLDEAEHAHVLAREVSHKKHSDVDRVRDHIYINAQTTLKVVKLYAPAISIGVVSIAALTGSHIALRRRNVAVMAAYTALDKGFREYRGRVIEELGEDKDREYRMGIETREIHDTKQGKVVTVKSIKGYSPYAKLFGRRTSSSWQETPGYNYLFLRCQQEYANNRLKARGHVLLNDVYDDLGLERTKEGCVVGWVNNGKGDGYIDFGIFYGDNLEDVYDFVLDPDGAIVLDFNVDGVVYDLI